MTPPRTPAPARAREPKRAVHGVVLLDKPAGLTSNAALQRVRRLYRAEKGGHTGTLDPLATGLLPICLGAATKFSQASLDADKGYRAVLRLGVTTTTGDAEGEVLARRPVSVDRDALRRACAALTGATLQRPPMHSALKHEGRPLYAYARAGVTLEREPRAVTVHSLEVVEGEGDSWTLDVRCSKGTYVRSLAESIGEALGCGAHLAALRRTSSGALHVRNAVTLEALEAADPGDRDRLLRPPELLLADWPSVVLDENDAARFLTGLRRRLPAPAAAAVRVHGPRGELLGSGRVQGGELIPVRLLTPHEVAALHALGTAPPAAPSPLAAAAAETTLCAP